MRLVLVVLLISSTVSVAQDLPTDVTTLFSGSGNCQLCHLSNGSIMVENGKDISPVTQWRSTMMANAAKDPLWRAKVATELAAFPQHSELIQNRCTVCHTPAGHTQSFFDGDSTYDLSQLDTNAMHRDGVTCTVCHQVQPENLGTPQSYSGGYEITDARLIFGPYQDPLPGPMLNHVNYTPSFGAHVNSSELCATCHTLFTPTLDAAGNIIGEFPEQTPYIEWKNSFYGQTGSATCQACHMRTSLQSQDISSMPPWHQVMREPYYQHIFVGANVTMLELLRDHAEEIGVTALSAHFDSTIAETRRSLENLTCQIDLSLQNTGDSTLAHVTLTNLTGHKLPTGIPLRRMWIHLIAQNESGATVFESGNWTDAGEIVGYDDSFEPHHDIVTAQDQVQVYEAVPGDNESRRTWKLLRAATHLKDNRIPPLGFSASHLSYDSVRIFGVPPSDSNFNYANGVEGSGSDEVTYRLPHSARVRVELMFQTVQPRLVEYLRTHNLPETDTFAAMYDEQSPQPILMTSAEISAVNTSGSPSSLPVSLALLPAYPNPFNGVTRVPLEVDRSAMVEFTLFDIRGRRILLFGRSMNAGHNEVEIDASDLPSGIYMLQAQLGNVRDARRLILMK